MRLQGGKLLSKKGNFVSGQAVLKYVQNSVQNVKNIFWKKIICKNYVYQIIIHKP